MSSNGKLWLSSCSRPLAFPGSLAACVKNVCECVCSSASTLPLKSFEVPELRPFFKTFFDLQDTDSPSTLPELSVIANGVVISSPGILTPLTPGHLPVLVICSLNHSSIIILLPPLWTAGAASPHPPTLQLVNWVALRQRSGGWRRRTKAERERQRVDALMMVVVNSVGKNEGQKIRSELTYESWHQRPSGRRPLLALLHILTILSFHRRLVHRLMWQGFTIHLGTLYFHQRSFRQGTGAQRPNGVSVSVVDRWGSESPAPRTHTAMIQRADRAASGGSEDCVWPVFSLFLCECVFPVCIFNLCGWVRVSGKMSYPLSGPMCAVMSAMQCFFRSLDASKGCLLDERISGASGNRRMIFWLYSALSGGDTPAITGSRLHLFLVKWSPETGANWEETYGNESSS